MTSERFGQQGCVAVVKLDVVGGCGTRLEPYGLADDKGDGLGLCLAYRLGGCRAPLGLVQHLMRRLMN